MEDRRSRVVGAIIVILLLVALGWGIYRFMAGRGQNRNQNGGNPTPTATVTPREDEEIIEREMGIDIPDEGQRSTLRDVIGGNRLAIARRIENDGSTELVVNANLEEPSAGRFYEAWLVRGDEQISLGELRLTKGGYL